MKAGSGGGGSHSLNSTFPSVFGRGESTPSSSVCSAAPDHIRPAPGRRRRSHRSGERSPYKWAWGEATERTGLFSWLAKQEALERAQESLRQRGDETLELERARPSVPRDGGRRALAPWSSPHRCCFQRSGFLTCVTVWTARSLGRWRCLGSLAVTCGIDASPSRDVNETRQRRGLCATDHVCMRLPVAPITAAPAPCKPCSSQAPCKPMTGTRSCARCTAKEEQEEGRENSHLSS